MKVYMKCSVCGERIWFWQDRNGDGHRDCIFMNVMAECNKLEAEADFQKRIKEANGEMFTIDDLIKIYYPEK